MNAESQTEPDPYVVLQLDTSEPCETKEKKSSTNPLWNEEFTLLSGDPTVQELNVSVSRALYNLFTQSSPRCHC